MSKFYYDVCIDYDEEKAEEGIFLKESKVEKTLFLDQPLLEQPGEYNLAVSKFSINTETLPVFIPELKQPQIYTENYFETNYFISMFLGCTLEGENIYISMTSENINFFYPGNNKAEVLKQKEEYAYLNNLSKTCFFYDYKDFIEIINKKITMIFNAIIKEKLPKITMEPFYLHLRDDGILELRASVEIMNKTNKYELKYLSFKISKNLYRQLGMGFTGHITNDGFFEIDLEKIIDYKIEDNYYCYSQSFSTLLNWNPLKAIIIGTDSLPVIPEFVPIAHFDGHLTHYKTDEYLDFLENLGLKYNENDRDVFKRNSLKVLDIYYPMTTAPGDIRSTCILSRDNIDQGQTIELLPSSPVVRFNVWVRWLDIYGNLHDLYQYPGCCTDIRFCFTKKPVNKENLYEGLNNVIGSLAPPDSKKPRKEPFLKQLADSLPRPNGKPDGIDIPGADNYGWVHL